MRFVYATSLHWGAIRTSVHSICTEVQNSHLNVQTLLAGIASMGFAKSGIASEGITSLQSLNFRNPIMGELLLPFCPTLRLPQSHQSCKMERERERELPWFLSSVTLRIIGYAFKGKEKDSKLQENHEEIYNLYCSCNKSINREKNLSHYMSKIKIFLSSIRWDQAYQCRKLSLVLIVVQMSKVHSHFGEGNPHLFINCIF